MKRSLVVSAGVALGIACSSTPTVIPTKNMDRPTDMTFVCLAMRDSELTGRPMSECHQRNIPDPATTSNDQRVRGTFAFIPNAARGELAVGDMDIGRLLDLTPAAPGYGMLPIGGDPESVASTNDGCWVATANRSTCDLTLVDPSRLLAGTFAQGGVAATPATAAGLSAQRLAIKTGSGRVLRSSLGEIAFLPGAVPETCGGSDGAKAVVTFPGCDMVALLDLSFSSASATITSAFYVGPNGARPAGAEPVCPSDCGSAEVATSDPGQSADGGVDGGAVDAGAGPSSSTTRLQPLALMPDGNRVYVAALGDRAVTSLEISDAGLGNPMRFQLDGRDVDPLGVNRLRLGVDPYAGANGQFLSGRGGQFLYAFTADNSVRVVDISTTPPTECDVNVVTAGLAEGAVSACFPVGAGYRRRPLAQGPGLRVPVFTNPDSPPPLPRDISFADLQPVATTNPHALSGQFGFLLASNGQVYVINVAPRGVDSDTKDYEENQTPTHSFREVRDVGNGLPTALSVLIAPQRPVVAADQAFATSASFGALEGPALYSAGTGTTSTWFGFPDPKTIISRTWNIIWEGALPETTRDTGLVGPPAGESAPAGELTDNGADFCASGVQPGDILMFSGCTQDADCQPDDEFSCQVTVSGGRGMCLPKAKDQTLALTDIPECARFLGSRLRYEITQVSPTKLGLKLKLDDVPKTSLNPCTTHDDCRPDTDHGKGLTSGHLFECVQGRCVENCTKDSDCRAGNFCEAESCVQAPPLDMRCFKQAMNRYSVRAGNSFVVYGSSMPRVRASKANGNTCQPIQSTNIELVERIPLSAPRCPAGFLVDPETRKMVASPLSRSAFSLPAGSNPCLEFVTREDSSTESLQPSIWAFFENPQIRFFVTNLDQYLGDLLAIHFEFQYGFFPQTIQVPSYEILLTMPNRIFTGPTMTPESPVRHGTGDVTYPYIYVMDQGRTALTPGSRGQVLRINARAGSSEIATFDSAISGNTPFQLQ
jgi:hypothetical protein